MSIYNSTWIATELEVVTSPDSGLMGRSGLVLDETRDTITILEDNQEVTFGKASIEFTIDGSDVVINGAKVGQRPEDRVHRKYRMA